MFRKTSGILLTFLVFSTALYPIKGLDKLEKIVKKDNSSSQLDDKTIAAGLKEALEIGFKKAVERVSKKDGYYGNSAIRIYLPKDLESWAKKLRKIGLGQKVDELEEAMNRGAEKAAPKAVDIFIGAIKKMTFQDARNILFAKKEEPAATQFFEKNTRAELYEAFFPIIKEALEAVGATKIYKFLLDKYNSLPLVKKKNYDLDKYVTNKALDGLFYVLAQEEKKIRKDPVARVTDLLKKVFN